MRNFVLFDLLEFGFDDLAIVIGATAIILEQLKRVAPPCRCAVEPFVERIQKVGPRFEGEIVIKLSGLPAQNLLDLRLFFLSKFVN